MDLSGAVEQNLERADSLLGEAAQASATLALLPELFPFPWFPASESAEHFGWAEAGGGTAVAAAAAMARRHGLTVVVPTYDLDVEHGTRYNTTYVVAPTGAVLGRYRKNHIPYHPGWYEKYYYEPGNLGFPVFVHQGLRFGIQTCWDNLFPEGSRLLGLAGVHLILAPRGTGDQSLARWRTALAANALANNCYVATVNRTGLEGGQWRFGGDSALFDPNGTVVAEATKPNQVVVATVDKALADASRAAWPFRDDRRPTLYQDLSRG